MCFINIIVILRIRIIILQRNLTNSLSPPIPCTQHIAQLFFGKNIVNIILYKYFVFDKTTEKYYIISLHLLDNNLIKQKI